jgi:glycosyltransferase involved in cell wall biosynthesis
MKIGIFTNNYLPNPYGVSGSVESFRKEFESLGHEVFIFAPFWKDYTDKNPQVYRYPSVDIKIKIRFPLAVPYSRKIDKVLDNLDLDIIHSQHPNLLGSAARKWARKKSIPLVFTWHTLYDQYAHFVSFIPRGLAAWWTIRNARNYANACDGVIVPTESVRPIILGWGVTNKNIVVIPTGVEEQLFENYDDGKIRNKFGIKSDDLVLFLNCRLTGEKNTEFLFRAILPVLQGSKKIKLLSLGGGYLKETLEKTAAEAGVGEQVVFAGEVKKEEVKDFYAAGDIFVYASKSETQGMIITEALYMGLPVVAVRATGISSLVRDGVDGLLVSENEKEFCDAVLRLVVDEKLRRQMGESGSKFARANFTDKISAQKMLAVYEMAIKEKKKI